MEMMRVPSSRSEWAMTTGRPASKPKVISRSSTVLETVIFERDARPGKHLCGILKAQTVLCEILPVLRFVPFVFHSPV
jgi:hypothetical protein